MGGKEREREVWRYWNGNYRHGTICLTKKEEKETDRQRAKKRKKEHKK